MIQIHHIYLFIAFFLIKYVDLYCCYGNEGSWCQKINDRRKIEAFTYRCYTCEGKICPSGEYCNGEGAWSHLQYATVECLPGYYCPTTCGRTECPAGVYCEAGASSAAGTGSCLRGYYCTKLSTTQTGDGKCDAGYYCPTGSKTKLGDGKCNAGRYCLKGSYTSDGTGPCDAGYYCETGAITSKGSGKCQAGYYCPSGSFSKTGNGECVSGRYCLEGATTDQGHGACKAGYYCPSGSKTEAGDGLCEAGKYCPSGSKTSQGLPDGGDCDSGYYCPAGSIDSHGTPNGGECEAGYFCEVGATFDKMMNSECPRGYYCPTGTTSSTEFICPENFYCPDRSESPTPCPIDFICPEGSSIPIPPNPIECFGYLYNDTQVCNGYGACIDENICECINATLEFDEQCNWNETSIAEFWDTYGNTIVTGSLAIILIILVIIIILVGFTMYYFVSSAKQKGKIKKYQKYIDEEDIIMEDQDKSHMASFKLHKKLLQIEYSEIKLKKIIGTGGFAEIFLADLRGMDVIMKLFRTTTIYNTNEFENFEKELEIASSISHPHIIRFFGACLKPPRVGIIMEFCENGDLREYIMRNKNISFENKIKWLHQILLALDFCHSKKIIHRDLKPENILLDKNLDAKVTDFGLAKLVNKEAVICNVTRCGTNIFISPELIKGTKKYNQKSDVYSFGIIMYCVLTKNFEPFGKNLFGIEYKIASDPNMRPRYNRNKYSKYKWYLDLMEKAWLDEPFDRPTSKELKVEFEKKLNIINRNSIKTPTPNSEIEQINIKKPPKKRRLQSFGDKDDISQKKVPPRPHRRSSPNFPNSGDFGNKKAPPRPLIPTRRSSTQTFQSPNEIKKEYEKQLKDIKRKRQLLKDLVKKREREISEQERKAKLLFKKLNDLKK